MNVIISGNALFTSAARGHLEDQGPLGMIALEVADKLGKERAKLITNVQFNGKAIVLQCKNSPDVIALTAALKEIGVRQSESLIPGAPGRLRYSNGGQSAEIQVTVPPSGVLAGA